MSKMNGTVNQYETIGFRTPEKDGETVVDISVVGKEVVTSHSYRWNGATRKDTGNFIFQYTLSGEGAIKIEGASYRLKPGQAFMVAVPSDHCYYFPKESEEWDFIFLTLKGHAALECWEKITRQFGHVLEIPLESALIQHVFDVYEQACASDLIDHYNASAEAYRFIMNCYRYFKQFKTNASLPASIVRATKYIEFNYDKVLTLEGIAASACVSKYYLIKLFREAMNMTPMQYVTKIRLEQAFKLLRNTDLTGKDIAVRVGYTNDNYFNKVFRKIVGMSPGEFRKNKDRIPFDRLVIH